MKTNREISLIFHVNVLKGKLVSGGGVNIPVPLIASLRAAAKRKKVRDVLDDSDESRVEQSRLFYEALTEIWEKIAADNPDYVLDDEYLETTGDRPPWKWGEGAIAKIGLKRGSSTRWQHSYDNGLSGSKRQQVVVEFVVGVQFV